MASSSLSSNMSVIDGKSQPAHVDSGPAGSNGGSSCEDTVAVVGMACRLPGGCDSPSALWDLLVNKRTAYSRVPEDRFRIESFYHPRRERPGSLDVDGGCFLQEDVRAFDPSFFGLTPNEATTMDPQQRKTLEVAYECFESAGLTLENLSGSRTGCFLANFTNDFSTAQFKDVDNVTGEPYMLTGLSPTILSNRISYLYNLCGPSVTLDTACSSSIYALKLACQSLLDESCDGALVIGTNLITTVEQFMATAKLGVLSPTSRCHTFDRTADGYARGEGVNALFLKRSSDARKDGDPIRAIVRACSFNANGRTPGGITNPNPQLQEKVIRDAYSRAGISDLSDTGYFECHGTGTAMGDPLEVDAVGKVFGDTRSTKPPLLIGSVKPNLGHAEAASGITSIIKCVLALEKGVVPPVAGLKHLNPNLNLRHGALKVATEVVPWPFGSIRRASLNSFGYGGANAHVVLDGLSEPALSYGSGSIHSLRADYLLVFSAHDAPTLRRNISAIANQTHRWDILDLAFTLGTRRSKLFQRAFAVVNTGDELPSQLNEHKLTFSKKPSNSRPRPLLFVFTGQGAQWPRMGAELFETFPVFSNTIQSLDAVLQKLCAAERPSWSIRDALLANQSESRVNEVTLSQTLCTSVQIGLIELLLSWNIKPTAVIGHSSGEIAAAYASGKISMEDAITVAYYRGFTVSTSKASGSMLAAGISWAHAAEVIGSRHEDVCVACVNSPKSVTLSGETTVLEDIKAELESIGAFARQLKTDGKAYHSPHMRPVGRAYGEAMKRVLSGSGRFLDTGAVMISSVTSRIVTETRIACQYWRDNLRSPVLFSPALSGFLANAESSFSNAIEIGPHSALMGPVREIYESLDLQDELVYLPTLKRGTSGATSTLTLAGNLYANDFPLDMSMVNAIEPDQHTGHTGRMIKGQTLTDLPRYQWNYTHTFWNENRMSEEYRFRAHPRHDLLGSLIPGGSQLEPMWRNIIRVKDVPWLADHKVGNSVIFPIAGYVAMAVEAMMQLHETQKGSSGTLADVTLRNVVVKSALQVPSEGNGAEVLFSLRASMVNNKKSADGKYDFRLTSNIRGNWTENCCGEISSVRDRHDDVPALSHGKDACVKSATPARWYDRFAEVGLNYGEAFRRMSSIKANQKTRTAYAKITQQKSTTSWPESRYAVHPSVIDSCLQTAFVAAHGGIIWDMTRCYLPVSFEELRVSTAPKDGDVETYTVGKLEGLRSLRASMKVEDCTGATILEARDWNLVASDSASGQIGSETSIREPFMQVEWLPDVNFLNDQSLLCSGGINDNAYASRVDTALRLLAHKIPGLKMLDTTGSLMVNHLDVLNTNKFAFNLYEECTIVKTLSMDHDTQHSTHNERVKYQQLDIHQDPTEQGFRASTYDLIIIDADGLNKQMAASIIPLLTSRGYILALPPSRPALTPPSDDDMSLMSVDRFDLADHSKPSLARYVQLLESSGLQICFTEAKLTLATLLIPTPDTSRPSMAVVYRKKPTALSSAVARILGNDGWPVQQLPIRACQDAGTRPENLILTVDLEEAPFLTTMEMDEFRSLQKLLATTSKALWITPVNALSGENSHYALIHGLSRTLMAEQPSLEIITLNVDPQDLSSRAQLVTSTAIRLFQELVSGNASGEREYALVDGTVHIPRLGAAADVNEAFHQSEKRHPELVEYDPERPWTVGIEQPGLLNSFYFKDDQGYPQPLGDAEVEVKVEAAGLSFKDITVAMGTFDVEGLGWEYAGRVSRTGVNVQRLQSGDRVLCMARGSFNRFVRCQDFTCLKLRDTETFEDMITMPLAYTTALYSLCHMARLGNNESVLIHAGSGGVGIAAINVAKAIGAEIYATVGSQAKRQFLVDSFGIPADHIFASRDSSFVDGILKATRGQGVDVVLCSLGGELLHQSFKCVSFGGRLVEIGRGDVYEHGRFDLAALKKSCGFFSVDLEVMLDCAPHLIGRLLNEMIENFRKGLFHPIHPVEAFHISELDEAMRYFMQRETGGRVVVTYGQSGYPPKLVKALPPHSHVSLSEKATYLLVGCLGGLGRSLSTWMMNHGARELLYLSRSGADKGEAAELVQDLRNAGVLVTVVKGDVSNPDDVERAITSAKSPIKGVIHAPMVLRDAIFESNMTLDAFRAVTRCKVEGAENLHTLLLKHDQTVDFFVMTSSVSSYVGYTSQGNYAAANAFLDSFARYRRTLGLQASTVALGMIKEVGYIEERQEITAGLERYGLTSLDEKEFLFLMEQAIGNRCAGDGASSPGAAYILSGLEPSKVLPVAESILPRLEKDRRSAALVSTLRSRMAHGASAGADSSARAHSDAAGAETVDYESVLANLKGQLCVILLLEMDQVGDSSLLTEFGIDSLVGTELRNWVFMQYKVQIQFLEILDPALTVGGFAQLIFGRIKR